MKRLSLYLLSLIITICTVVAVPTLTAAWPAHAQSPKQSLCEGSGGTYGGNGCSGGTTLTVAGVIKTIATVLTTIIGAASVIMIIIGGFRYVLSNGNQSDVTAAKNTILYALIGLIVAAMAFAIVNFVVTKV